jgi:zinc transport system substrate-binding protein
MKLRVVLMVLAAATLAACGGSEAPGTGPEKSGVPVVMTTFYPTTYFAERIGGDLVDVVCPLPPDADPIFWEPTDEEVARYQEADLIIVNGAQFEKWVDKVTLPESKIVDTARSFEKGFLRFKDAITHSHGPAGKHAHEGIDGHTWLDPEQARVQATAIRDGLKKLLPAHAAEFDASCAKLVADLDALDAAFQAIAADYDDHPIYASHPAYNYLARRYGLKVINLNLDPEEMPDDESFGKIRAKVAETPASFLLWEADPLPEIAARFSDELGLASVTFSPCEMMDPADLSSGQDYLKVMKANVEALKPVLLPKEQ